MANQLDYSKLVELGVLGGLGAANARGARQDANTQINDIRSSQNLFGQDSAYAQQLRQQLERKDAAGGRRSQYGPREVELQARLAEASSRQQAQNAPTINALYQQKQAAGNSRGRDFASILARSGGFSKLSPLVQGLFKRKMDESPEAYGADPSNTFDYSTTPSSLGAEAYGADPSNTFDYTTNADYSSAFDTYDFGGGLDSADYSSAFNTVDFGDYSAGLDAADYSSAFMPGYAAGGKVNIFQAIKQRKPEETKAYKEVNTQPAQTTARPIPNIDRSLNDRQEFARGAQLVNAGSRLAVKGGILGPYSGIPGIFAADTAQERVGATGVAGLTAVNPLLGLAVGIMPYISKAFGGGETKTPFGQQMDNYFENGKIKDPDKMFRGNSSMRDIVRGRLKNEAGFSDEKIDQYLQYREQNPDFKYTAPPPAELTPDQMTSAGTPQQDTPMPAPETYSGGGGYAEGGPVYGPGTGTSDSIVARLSHGEYVNTAKTVDSLGTSLFDKLEAKAKKSSPEELKKFKAGLQALF